MRRSPGSAGASPYHPRAKIKTSDIHANFIVNNGNATARDVLELIQLIQARVKEQRGIDLQVEVEIVGED